MITPRDKLFPATFAAFLLSPCPSVLARSALVPTPVPMPTATISICTGNTRVSAFNAASLPTFIFPTKALSTILYTACSAIDKIIGMPICTISLFTGISFILLLSFILIQSSCLFHKKNVYLSISWTYADKRHAC